MDRVQRERPLLPRRRRSPSTPTRSCRLLSVLSARIAFDGKRDPIPPQLARPTVAVHVDGREIRILHRGQVVALHTHSYERRQLIVLPDHRLAVLGLSRRSRAAPPRNKHLTPLGPSVARLYGSVEVLSARPRTLALATYDAAYVENILLAERRQ